MHELFACVNNGRRARNRANKISVFYLLPGAPMRRGGFSLAADPPRLLSGWWTPSTTHGPLNRRGGSAARLGRVKRLSPSIQSFRQMTGSPIKPIQIYLPPRSVFKWKYFLTQYYKTAHNFYIIHCIC